MMKEQRAMHEEVLLPQAQAGFTDREAQHDFKQLPIHPSSVLDGAD
jgi:hypothetical protein